MENTLKTLPEYFFEGSAVWEKITGGLHCCCLSGQVCLEYVSDSFCEMLGYSRAEIQDVFQNRYISMCCSEDRELLLQNIEALAGTPGKRTFVYHMLKKDGSRIRVRDTMASGIMKDGRMMGYSVLEELSEDGLTEKPQIMQTAAGAYENSLDSVPYGTMEFTLDSETGFPRIRNCNSYMREILGMSFRGGECAAPQENALQFMFLRSECRDILAYLRTAVAGGPALKVERTIHGPMSRPVEISGWVRKERDSSGEERFFAVCIENSKLRRGQAEPVTLLLEELKEVYEEIIELDFDNQTAETITSRRLLPFAEGVRYNLTDAAERMIEQCLDASCREAAYKNLDKLQSGRIDPSAQKTQFHFLAAAEEPKGSPQKYRARIVPLSVSRVLVLAKKETADRAGTGSRTVIPMQKKAYRASVDTLQSVPQTGIYARTFGHFELFVNGEPVHFKGTKTKELMALLIDRRGGYLDPSEAVSYLWENEPLTKSVHARYRKTVLKLKESLKEYGIEEIFLKNGSSRKINIADVRSDLTDFLSGKEGFAHLYQGFYMYDYSWGEVTCCELEKAAEYLHQKSGRRIISNWPSGKNIFREML